MPDEPKGLPGGKGGDGQTDGRNFSPFYGTLSPAQKLAKSFELLENIILVFKLLNWEMNYHPFEFFSNKQAYMFYYVLLD